MTVKSYHKQKAYDYCIKYDFTTINTELTLTTQSALKATNLLLTLRLHKGTV